MTWLPGFTSPYLHLLAFNVVIKGKVARGGKGGGCVGEDNRTIFNINRPTNSIIFTCNSEFSVLEPYYLYISLLFF